MVHQKGTKSDLYVAVYVPPGSAITIDVKQNNRTALSHPYSSCICSNIHQLGNADENSPPHDLPSWISICSGLVYAVYSAS